MAQLPLMAESPTASTTELLVVTRGAMGGPRLQFSRAALREHPFYQREAAWAKGHWRFHILTVMCVLAATCWYPIFKGWDWRALPVLAAAEILVVSILFELPPLLRFARLRRSGWFAHLLLTPWPPAATVGAFLMAHHLGQRFGWAGILFFATIFLLGMTYFSPVAFLLLGVLLLPFLIGAVFVLRQGWRPRLGALFSLGFDDFLGLLSLVDLPILALLLILLPVMPMTVMNMAHDLGLLSQLLLATLAVVPISLGYSWIHRRVTQAPESKQRITTLDDLNERIRAFAMKDDFVAPPRSGQ